MHASDGDRVDRSRLGVKAVLLIRIPLWPQPQTLSVMDGHDGRRTERSRYVCELAGRFNKVLPLDFRAHDLLAHDAKKAWDRSVVFIRNKEGQDPLFAATLNQVFSALTLKPWPSMPFPPLAAPGYHDDDALWAYAGLPVAREQEPHEDTAPLDRRPAHGYNKEGRPDLKPVLLSLGVSGDGALPLRLGIRDGNTSGGSGSTCTTIPRQLPGNQGPTTMPTAAVVLALFISVMLVQLQIDNTAVQHIYDSTLAILRA